MLAHAFARTILIAACYERGVITHFSLFSLLLETLNDENVSSFFEEIPEELRNRLIADVASRYPQDDDVYSWSRMIILEMGSWSGPAETIAQRRKEHNDQRMAATRRGVKILRENT